MLGWYRLLFLPALLLGAPYYGARMLRRGGYGRDWPHRLGRYGGVPPRRPGVRRVWLQAVSVGEVLAVEPLVRALAAEGHEVVLTTTTSTGYALARERLRAPCTYVGLFPLDFAPWSARAWECLRPDLALLTESELWPEHLHQARRRGVPCVLLNARLSPRSFHRWQRFPRLARALLGQLDTVSAASLEDGARFTALGVAPERLHVCGNLKFDFEAPAALDDTARTGLLAELGFGPQDGPVVMGLSTWPGEEEALLAAWEALRTEAPGARLLLLPRHAERRGEVAALLARSAYRWHQRSTGAAPEPAEICLADTTGEARTLLQVADVVFAGKSLPPHRLGQSPIEAAAAGKALCFGPGMDNFAAAAAGLLACGGALRVDDPGALTATVKALGTDEARRARLGEAARDWWQKQRGALANTRALLRPYLET